MCWVMAKKQTQQIEQEDDVTPEVIAPITRCYKFNENTSVAWQIYLKDSCIHLSEDQLSIFWPYVRICTWEAKTENWPCKRC